MRMISRLLFASFGILLCPLLIICMHSSEYMDNERPTGNAYYKIIGDDNIRHYEYFIYNSSGKIVDRGEVGRIPPTICFLSESLIEIRFHGGTYADLCKYYDTEKDIFSDSFWNPFWVSGRTIVYYNSSDEKLVVSDIFNPNVFQKEFSIDMITTGPPEKIEFNAEEASLTVRYMKRSDNNFVTAVFDLS